MLLKLAWKNIWRNKKRTVIVSVSIFFAVFLSCLMRSIQIGSFDYMINSLTHMYIGHIQIQQPDFWENRSLDNSIILEKSQIDKITQIEHISGASKRLETFALLSNDTLTHIAQVIGIDPVAEKGVTALQQRVIKGAFIKPGDTGILLAEELAKKLKLQLQDTVVLFSSGYHGMSAAALLEVQGILHFPIASFDKIMMYMNLDQAQNIFSMPDRITSYVITVDELENIPGVMTQLTSIIDPSKAILDWQELMPGIKQTITFKTGSNFIMIGILYMVIGFGIFGVIMMMTLEREKEYGILHSIGMSKLRMAAVTVAENFLIVLVGVFIGIILAFPVLAYLAQNPIPVVGELAKSWEQMGIEPVLSFSNNGGIFLFQALIVFIIAGICSFYPIIFLTRLKVVNALKK